MEFSASDEIWCGRLDSGNLDATADLEAACFSLPWSREQLAAAFAQPNYAAFGLRVNGMPAGYISLYHNPDELEILNLAVLPAYRRRGFGKKLLRTALLLGLRLGIGRAVLEVRADNNAALGLYLGLGFTEAGRRPGYYNGEDALVLELPLKPKPESM